MQKQTEPSQIKHFIRGGQTFLHNFRMFNQIFGRAFLFVGLVFLFIDGCIILAKTTPYTRYVVSEWFNANLVSFFDNLARQTFILPNGETVTLYNRDFLNLPLVHEILAKLWLTVFYSSLVSLGICIGVFSAVSAWLRRRGREQTEDKHIRGDSLVESHELAKIVKQRAVKVSSFSIGEVPLPERAEFANIFVHGSVGTGKSETIKRLLDQIRRSGDRAIVLDKGCDLIRFFYRYEQDTLLNALDERDGGWDLWADCQTPAHFETLAAALIPMPVFGGGDPFWINAARTIFAAAAYQMRNDPERSTLKLLKVLLTSEMDAIKNILQGTEAETLMSDKIEKTAISIKSVLATYLKSLKYLRNKPEGFSIRRWINDDSHQNWMFISSLSDSHETLKPLISGWLDIAANALTSLTPSRERRIWIILDELPSLHQLPCLPGALSEARKFGGCFVLGMQSVAQLRKLYGRDAAEELSGLCNTRVFFRTPTSDTANWISKELGQCEIEEIREGYSYGENSMRAGVSLSHQTVQRYIVNYSEVMALPDLNCYLRLPGDYPVAKLKLDYQERKAANAAFVAHESAQDPELAEIDALLDKYELPTLKNRQDSANTGDEIPKPRKRAKQVEESVGLDKPAQITDGLADMFARD